MKYKDTVQQLSVMSINLCTIGSILYLLNHFQLIDENIVYKKQIVFFMIFSLLLFLLFSSVKIYSNKLNDRKKDCSIVFVTANIVNFLFSTLGSLAALLLLLNEIKPEYKINDKKVNNIALCTFFVMLWLSVGCLYYLPKLLMSCTVCTNINDPLLEDNNNENIKYVSEKFDL